MKYQITCDNCGTQFIIDAEPGIQLGQQDLNGVDLHIREILIGPEEVLQKRDVPRQQGGLAKGIRGCLVGVLVPAPHFQHIDALFSGHQVNEAPT